MYRHSNEKGPKIMAHFCAECSRYLARFLKYLITDRGPKIERNIYKERERERGRTKNVEQIEPPRRGGALKASIRVRV